MVNVYVCDKCGKEMEKKYNTWIAGIGVTRVRLFVRNDDYIKYEYDLCPECGKKLLDWAKNGKKVEL